MPKVLIPTKLDTIAAEILTNKGYTVVQDTEAAIEDVVKANPDATAIIVRSEKVTKEIIDALPSLKLVVRAGAGYNTIDTAYAREKGIDVMNTPGANSNAVAEEVIALVLGGFRHLIPADASTRKGLWEKKNFMGRELTGKTVGIIGLGNIGQLVVKRMAGFETKFFAFDPIIDEEVAADMGVTLCADMKEVFSKSDIITLHIPENDKTRGCINKELFDVMADGSVLVNCARSGVINEDDLRAAKQEKTIIFCNDVYAKDAAGDKSVADIADIMVPHLGASTVEANGNAASKAAHQIIGYDEQGITACVVN